MKIPKKPRYDLVMHVVSEFFHIENIVGFPIDPFKIIRRNRWGLISYSELARKHNVNVQDIINEFQTEDACVIRSNSNYTIAYNDTMETYQRIRFTLMHEIGHIVLGHLDEFSETAFKRGGLTEPEYDVLEREANAFARNVLSPPFIFERFKEKFGRFIIDDASRFFLISRSAIQIRIKMLNWDLNQMSTYTPRLLTRFQGYINSILDSKQCLRCKHCFISRFARYCPVCAHTRFIKKRGENRVIYSGFIVDENGRVKECARCSNEEIGEHDWYCKVCAAPVVNKCTSISYDFNGAIEWECGTIAAGNARYCTKCGSETVFFKNGLLEPWQNEKHDRERYDLEALFSE